MTGPTSALATQRAPEQGIAAAYSNSKYSGRRLICHQLICQSAFYAKITFFKISPITSVLESAA